MLINNKVFKIPESSELALFRGIERGDTIAQLEIIGLSTRTINALETINIIYLEDLINTPYNKLLSIDGMGKNSIEQICKILVNYCDYEEKIMKDS